MNARSPMYRVNSEHGPALSQDRSARLQHTLLATFIAMALGAGSALAQDESAAADDRSPALIEQTEIRSLFEFGLGYVSQDSFRFGKYTGLEDKGAFGVFNLFYSNRTRYDAERSEYVTVRGTDLGLRSRSAEVDYGRQGNFRLRAGYDQIPTFRSDTAKTIFDGAGSTQLTLPASWVPATSTAGMTQLLPSLKPVALETERQRFGVRLDKILPGHFDFTTKYQYEEKDGLKSIGGVIGNSGGNPRAVMLPEPVDYKEHQFDVIARYTEKKYQLELRYHLSDFSDQNTALTWQNPFSAINGWAAAAGFPTGQGSLALPPDNKFHQGTLLFGYNLSDRTRFTADAALGRMTQNDPFLPNTINPVLAASITEPLPRDSLNGEINTTVINLRLSSRPTTHFNYGASFRYDDRDNNTPIDQYVYIGGDSTVQNTAAISDRRRFNEPYSYREYKYKLDAGYRLDDGTRFTGVAERREVRRTFSERRNTHENTFSLNASRPFGELFDASLRYIHADRGGSHYDGAEPLLTGFIEGFIDTLAGGFENAPLLRKFNKASRVRDQVGFQATYSPLSFLSFGFDGSYSKDNYNKTELGLTDSKVQSYTFDVTATPTAQWSASAYYTYDKLDTDQNGVSFSGGAGRVAQVNDPTRFWTALHRDRVDTGGFNLTWKPSDQRLQFGFDLMLSTSRDDIEVSAGSALTTAPLPTNRVTIRSGSLYGQYRLSDSLSLRAKVQHEHYRSSDFALDGVEANQLANVILFGEEAPDFDVTVGTLTMVYTF